MEWVFMDGLMRMSEMEGSRREGKGEGVAGGNVGRDN